MLIDLGNGDINYISAMPNALLKQLKNPPIPFIQFGIIALVFT